MNESSIKLEKGFYPNTELGIDLLTLTMRHPTERILS